MGRKTNYSQMTPKGALTASAGRKLLRRIQTLEKDIAGLRLALDAIQRALLGEI